MEEQPLIVFSPELTPPTLRLLWEALQAAGYPAELGVGTVGPATEAELDMPDWGAVFVRWLEPELHEAWLIERDVRGEEEEADAILQQHLQRVANHPDTGGQYIVLDQLRRTQTVYTFQLYDALFADADHLAWEALEVALRCLAEEGGGLIYAEAEGYYDIQGEMLLVELDEEDTEDD